MYFIVVELQFDGTTPAILTNTYSSYAQALSKYHSVLAAAAISGVKKHGAYLLSDNDSLMMHEIFDRDSINPIEEEE